MSAAKRGASFERHSIALKNAMEYISSSSAGGFVVGLYLYGSFARGDFSWDSDIDLFLVLQSAFKEENPFWKEDLLKLRSEISGENVSNVLVDLKIVFGEEWSKSSQLYYQNIRKEGKKLW